MSDTAEVTLDGKTIADEVARSLRVVREPLTYERHAPHSYFRDLIFQDRDARAAERIERHDREVVVEMERRDKVARTQLPDELELRTNPNVTDSTGGYFSPPIWLIDQFATVPRAPRVLANLMPTFPLPAGVSQVNIPRLTTGNVVGTVPVGGSDPALDAVDAAVSSTVVTISGHGDAALQQLEQSPVGAHLDWAWFKDLNEAYDEKLEVQLLNGSNANGQLAGLLNVVPSANVIAYTDASPTSPELYTSVGKAIATLANGRKLPPETWLLSTSRLVWIGSGEDNNLRPLLLDNREEPGEVDILSFPAKLTDAMPTNLGAGGNQDAMIACRPSDGILLESSARTSVQTEVVSGTLQARIQLHRYVAALQRYPAGIATVQGTGMIVQSGF